jgi:hypothetical protein
MEVEGNIPYLTRGGEEACVGEEDASGTDDEVDTFGPTMARDRSGLLIRPHDQDPISNEDMRTYVNIDDMHGDTLRKQMPRHPSISEIMSLKRSLSP